MIKSNRKPRRENSNYPGDRDRAKGGLLDSGGWFRELVESLPTAVYVCQADGVITLYNRRAVELWGRKPRLGDTEERFCGSFRLYRLDGTFLPHQETPMAQALCTGISVWDQEVVIERPDGSRIMVAVNISPMHNELGEVIGAINCFQDISGRKRTEEALEESEQRFRKIFEEGPLGMAIVGLDYRFLKVNATLCQMVGYTEQELIALTFPDITHPEDIDMDVELARRVFRGEIPNYRIEKRYITKNREVLWIHLTASVIRDENGKPLYGLGIIENITERKRAEETLQALYRASLQIQEPLTLQERLDRLLQTARTVLELDRVNILLADPKGEWFQAVASLGTAEPLEAIRVPIGLEGGGIAQAYFTQQMIVWDGKAPVPEELSAQAPL